MTSESGKTDTWNGFTNWLEENGMGFLFTGNEQAAHENVFTTHPIYADRNNKYVYYQMIVLEVPVAGRRAASSDHRLCAESRE